jgi:hypothetical protein
MSVVVKFAELIEGHTKNVNGGLGIMNMDTGIRLSTRFGQHSMNGGALPTSFHGMDVDVDELGS